MVDSAMNAQYSDDFVRAMTRCQERLHAYIRAMVPYADAAREILQETNVVLLRKAGELQPGQDFEHWACRVAHFEVLSYRRDRARDRHLFDESVLELLAPHAERAGAQAGPRMDALEQCLEKLEPRQRDLLTARYTREETVKGIAEQLHQSARTVATKLFRIRQILLDCIERKLASEERR